MKLVTWKGYRPKECRRCPHMIQKGEKAWRIMPGKIMGGKHTTYFCEKCGEEIQQ